MSGEGIAGLRRRPECVWCGSARWRPMAEFDPNVALNPLLVFYYPETMNGRTKLPATVRNEMMGFRQPTFFKVLEAPQ